MNLNFCRYQCGRSWHPRRIMKASDGRWYAVMGEHFHNDECDYVRIEPAQELLDNPPEGWFVSDDGSILFEYGNAEDVMWKVRLMAGESACPYVAEHTMYDIQHENRISAWRERERKRLARIDELLSMNNGGAECRG